MRKMNAFDEVIGYEKIKKELMVICDRIRNPGKYLNLNVSFPNGILLHGEPGVGKSLMAECFIKEADVKSFVIRKDKSDGAFTDEIKRVFEEARKNQPSIILLDDMDKFANEEAAGYNADEMTTIQSCIDNTKKDKVFILATANNLDMIPDSLMRAGRINRVIYIPNPTGDEATAIIHHYMNGMNYVHDIDEREIVDLLEGSSCAQLEAVINDAGLYAGYAGHKYIGMNDIIKAFIVIKFRDMNSEDGEEICSLPYDIMQRIAYHEAGHAVVSEVLNPGSVRYIYLGDNGINSGITGYSPDLRNRAVYSAKEQEHSICRSLGGKAATEVKFGETDLGCQKDIADAMVRAESMIDDYAAFGFGEFTNNYYTPEATRTRKNNMIEAEMERYYRISKKIIMENIDLLDAIASLLLEKRYMLSKDMARLKNERNH